MPDFDEPAFMFGDYALYMNGRYQEAPDGLNAAPGRPVPTRRNELPSYCRPTKLHLMTKLRVARPTPATSG